ncbi:MAG: chromosome segregation protein SMC [Deltaproteobacteria bacterium]|nr:chromosome segregation protein SMC [Deltaproteobacteria bacterium]
MKIKSLDISGFKSFCDRTKVLFDNSLTAVVGPNGCGKSNIVDAIRWALGEQSAKNLRGKGMGDVIFNGSEKRGPQSMAEVTITFDNTDGLSHPLYADYPEIAITRRLHRDGSSEYLINKNPCRLKDVTELFMGTGGGARAYSIIEQGRIGLIVSSRSEDRRSMIEEAAGITRFKKARQTAQKKMEQTRQNLLRIKDVVQEMGRSLESLKRQARKAERYNLYAEEQRDAELYVNSHKYLELLAAGKTAQLSLTAAQDEYDTLRNSFEAAEARIESLRMEEAVARNDLEKAKQKAQSADNEISVMETEVRHLEDALQRIKREEASLTEQQLESESRLNSVAEEKQVLSQRLGSLQTDFHAMASGREEVERRAEDARMRLSELGREFDEKRDRVSRCRARIAASQSACDSYRYRIEEAESRLEVTRSERKTLEEQILGLSALTSSFEQKFESTQEQLNRLRTTARTEGEAFENLREQVQLCDDEFRRVKDELTAKTSRLESLQQVNESMGRHDNGVKQAVDALSKDAQHLFSGMLVDYIRCPKEYELALAVVLADKLQALVSADHDAGFELLSWLKERDLGRVIALPSVCDTLKDSLTGPIRGEGVVGNLFELIQVESDVRDAISNLLQNVYVVNDETAALRLWRDNTGKATFVTLDGQVIDNYGIQSGGRAGTPGADLLEQKREIRELEAAVASLSQVREDLELRFETLKEEMLRRQEASEQARLEAQRMEFVLSEVDKDRGRALDDLENAKSRNANLDRDYGNQMEQLERMCADQQRAATELEESTREVDSLQRVIEEQSELIAACRDETDRLAGEVTDAKIREARFRQQHESAVERSSQLVSIEEEVTSQLSRISRRKQAIASEIGKTAGGIVAAKEKLEFSLNKIDALASDVTACARVLDGKSQILTEATMLFKDQRGQLDKTSKRVTDLQIVAQKAVTDVSYLLSNIREKYDVDIERVLGDYHWRPLPGRAVFERISELKGLIARMGSINPSAIEEYAETQTRYDEKVNQKADVEQALEDLEAAIARMDKDSRRMFKETFDSINQKFQEIFPRLFKGGHASLALTEPDDLLNTGVDIIASPPGKKLRAIELMSGGEKALTAVSLLFAIFMQKPSPFCLLDEVDAPLDDANIGRFIDMVREMTDRSQFVIITHSKITMEGADALYGVTMQEPGVSKMISVNLVHQQNAQVANS